jgi:hypothetical protein
MNKGKFNRRGEERSPRTFKGISRKRQRFSVKTHWHNVYFIANAVIWTGLIILLALVFGMVFYTRNLLILIGICAAISVVSSAVLLRPGHRLAGVVVQVIAWTALVILSGLVFSHTLTVVAVLFLPAGLLSLGLLAVLSVISRRAEKHLHSALKRK